jgi:hypothetical protein
MRVDYRLLGAGWAECEIEIQGKTATVPASYLSNALDELIAAAASVARGAAEATARWEEEPGEIRWRLTRVGEERLRVRILHVEEEFYDDLPDERGAVLLDAECRLRTFAGAVLSAAQRVLEKHGTKGYQTEWGMHGFPMERMRALEAALHI